MLYSDGNKRRLPSFMTTKVGNDGTPIRSTSSSSIPLSPYQPVPNTSSSSSTLSSKSTSRRTNLVCWLFVIFVCILLLAAQLGFYNVFELYYSSDVVLSEEAIGKLVSKRGMSSSYLYTSTHTCIHTYMHLLL